MGFDVFVQLTINGLIAGSKYGLVAVGFALIYATNRFMHFAHGVSVIIAGYMFYTFFTLASIPFVPAMLFTLIVSVALGLGMYRLVYLPLKIRRASNVVLLIVSISLLIVFENLIQAIYDSDLKVIGVFSSSQSLNFLGASITTFQIGLIITAGLLFGGLYALMKFTPLGRNMRAVANNTDLARIVGINDRRIADYSFIFGSLLAGLAGILIGIEQNLLPTMGTNLVIKGFTGAIIGGILSVPASILGSFILGLVENYGVAFLSSGFKDAIAFIILFLFLLFRPEGLLGKRKGVKADG